MGIERSQIILEYKAEVHQAVASLRTLTGEQKAQARDAIKVMQDQIKEHEKKAARDAYLYDQEAKAHAAALKKQTDSVAQYNKEVASSGSVFGKVEGGIRSFNSTVGLLAMGLGAIPRAIETVTLAVGLLGKAWNAVGDVFERPQLKMMWEKTAFDEMVGRWQKNTAIAAAEFAATYANIFGSVADVDSDKSITRRRNFRAEVVRKDEESTANLRFDSESQVERQKAAAQDQRDRANRTGPYAPKRGGPAAAVVNDGHGLVAIAERAAFYLHNAAIDMREMSAIRLDADVARLLRADSTAIALDKTAGIEELMAGGVPGRNRGPSRDAAGFALGKGGEAYRTGGKKSTLLEGMFGTPEDIEIYHNAIGGLMDAASSGYTALVTSSESFGKAAKAVMGQTILAEGAHMFVLAIKESAMAIGSLATGNFAAAASHGIAAAKFGAGAALAGVVARGLGANDKGGWGGRPSDGGGSGGSSSGSSSSPAPINRTIVLGSGWGDETERQRASKIARDVRRANGYEPPPRGVAYS